MAIKTYIENNHTCYLISVTVRSTRRTGIRVQKERRLGAVSHREAIVEHNKLKNQASLALFEKEKSYATWGSLVKLWYKQVVMECRVPTSTKLDNYNTLCQHTKSWMTTPVDQLNHLSLQIIINDMVKEGYSRSRVKSVKGVVNTLFQWAVLQKLIPSTLSNPAFGCLLPTTEPKAQPILNRVEIQRLLSKAKEWEHEYYPLWAVAFETGCRSGELLALKWTDVDFEQKLISVSKSYNSRMRTIKGTKTNENRFLPISPVFEQFLKELKLKTFLTGYVLPRIKSWQRGEAAKVTRDFCKVVGIPEINLHAARACFAIASLQAGNSIAETMKLGGWENIESFQHYVRLAGIEIKGLTDKFNFLPESKAGQLVEFTPKSDNEVKMGLSL
jgi:integrase